MKRNYKPPFDFFVKKQHKPLQLVIEDAVDAVCENPKIGEARQEICKGFGFINSNINPNFT
jgi:hypothetical protein